MIDAEQKKQMIENVTDTMVAIEGEVMRGVTWVRIVEIAGGEWAIGGKPLHAADIHAMQAQGMLEAEAAAG